MSLLTIVGGAREAWSVWRLGRGKTLCALGARSAASGAAGELRST
jgi:hypothetical protein